MAAELGRNRNFSLQRTFFGNDKNIELGRIQVKKCKNFIENICALETVFNLLVFNLLSVIIVTESLKLENWT